MNALPPSPGPATPLAAEPAAGAAAPLISIEHLSKSYTAGEKVLDDVCLSIAPGEIYGIIGRSGAGKSTLVRCLNGLEQPSAGRVVVDRQDITGLRGPALRRARRGIGMVFQHFNLLSARTAAGNVALPLEMAGIDRPTIQRRIPELLALVGLAHKADAYPVELSGGQKQRVGIARALALEPRTLLSDEATSALDPETTEQILELLKDINQRLGLTILLISHEMEVVRDIASHVAVLDRGKVIESGATYDVFAFPQTAIARSFLRSIVAHELPAAIARQVHPQPTAGASPVIRLVQAGAAAQLPVIALLQEHFGIAAQMLHARVDTIGGRPLGVMALKLPGAQPRLETVLAFLRARHLHAEVLGHAV
ncbi:methionine ABC transporter ATP-binding protein [Xanthobacter sediminis]